MGRHGLRIHPWLVTVALDGPAPLSASLNDTFGPLNAPQHPQASHVLLARSVCHLPYRQEPLAFAPPFQVAAKLSFHHLTHHVSLHCGRRSRENLEAGPLGNRPIAYKVQSLIGYLHNKGNRAGRRP